MSTIYRVPISRKKHSKCAKTLEKAPNYVFLVFVQIAEPSLVLCMDCSSKTMSSRLLEQSQSSQHLMDSAEVIMQRIESYYQTTEPVIAYCENKIPVFKVNCPTMLDHKSSIPFMYRETNYQ